MADLLVNFAILILLAICFFSEAKPLGTTLDGDGIACLEVKPSASAISRKPRGLKQTGDSTKCDLSEDQIGDLLDDDKRVWSLNNAALYDFGLQAIVDCTEEGDVLLFEVENTFKPTERIVIPWNLTLSSSVEKTGFLDGIFPPSTSKLRMTCPANDIGIFLVKAADVLFANLVFEDCVLTEDNSDAGIVEVGSCDSEDKSGTIRLHNVDFVNNRLTSANGLNVDVGCSSVEMMNVTFEENDCSGICGASLSVGSNILRNVTILSNRENAETSTMIYCPPDSEVAAENIVSRGNAGTAFYADGASLEIKDSIFEENFVGSNSTAASGIHLQNSEAKIKNCEFINNSGELGSSSLIAINCGSVEIAECSFARNNASDLRGAAVYSNRTESLKVKQTIFFQNIAANGGAVYLEDTSSEFEDCVFKENAAAGNAGGLFLQKGTSTVANCMFEDNVAVKLGGGLHCGSGILNVFDSQFNRNKASGGAGTALASGCVAELDNIVWEDNSGGGNYGGGLLVKKSLTSVKNSVATANSARRGGGIFFDNGNGTCSNVTFTKNKGVEFGGGLATLNSTVEIDDGHFEDNKCQDGGAMYFGVLSTVSATNCSVISNSATRYGGGVAVTGSSFGIISESTFWNNSNSGSFGGCFFVSKGSLTLSKVSVSNSTSGQFGGALIASLSTISITDSVFEDNIANSDGGAIGIVSGSLKAVNIKVTRSVSGGSGGGIYIANAVSDIINSNLSGNMAKRNGGGFSFISGNLTMTNISINRSSAGKDGGGIWIKDSVLDIKDSNIIDNYAKQRGGGIYSKNSTLKADQMIFAKNKAGSSGGCLDATNGSFVFTNSYFNHCGAEYGAAVNIYKDVNGSLVSCYGYNNSATINGGMVHIQRSNLTIIGGEFVESKAFFGAGVNLAEGWLLMNNSVFSGGNASVWGGAINSKNGSYIVAHDVLLHDNEASYGGSLCTKETHTWATNLQISNSRAKVDGGGLYAYENSSFLCTGCSFKNNSANGNGGGAYLDSKAPQFLAYQFDDTTFESNGAIFGGGISFTSEVGLKECSNPEKCTFMALRGSIFRDNNASAAGGGIMSRDIHSIRSSCSYIRQEDPLAYVTKDQLAEIPILSSTDQVCEGWKNNKAGRYGKDLATYSYTMKKYVQSSDNQQIRVDQTFYTISDHKMGSPLPALLFERVDQLGQGPAITSENENLTATMRSPDNLFDGSNEVSFIEGFARFPNIVPRKVADLYTVVVDFNEESMPSFELIVRIRNCTIGEALVENGTRCRECSVDSYNFNPGDPKAICKRCPDHATCLSQVIVPNRGYWHQTPCSHRIRPCLSERSCSNAERDSEMENLTKYLTHCNFTDKAFVHSYTDVQCRVGYRGPLCGSCEKGYGRSRVFRCEPCHSLWWNYILVGLVFCVLLALSGFAIRSSLPSYKRRRAESGERDTGPLFQSMDSSSGELIRNRQHVIEMACLERPSSGSIRNQLEIEVETNVAPDPERTRELAKWKAVEIFKITINYLQVVAIVVSVNTNWSESLIKAFEAAEFMGGVTSEAATKSVDCLTANISSIPTSAIRTVVSILVPLAATGFWAVFWAIAMYRLQESTSYLFKRSILSVCAVSYLSYIAVTKTAVNVLYCVDVYDSLDPDSDGTTNYWAVDTHIKCYKGSHAILAGVIGWPVLILFSFGFPVAVATILIRIRDKQGVESELLSESTGFLYRAYSSRYIFWESVIMLRKAVLVVVVVFAYPLGGNLQAALGVCVLMIALYFHLSCSPFREEFSDLNDVEGLSLLAASLTFTSGLFFNDDHTSDIGRILLTVILFVANIFSFGFLTVCFLKSAEIYFRMLLEDEELLCNSSDIAFIAIFVYLTVKGTKYFNQLFARRDFRNLP